MIRGNADSLIKLISGLDVAGIKLIAEGVVCPAGGRSVRRKLDPTIVKVDPGSAAEATRPGRKPA